MEKHDQPPDKSDVSFVSKLSLSRELAPTHLEEFMTKLTTIAQRFRGESTLEVEVGTTGLRGGDVNHGGRTFLRIAGGEGTSINLYTEESGREITVLLGGDTELQHLIRGLLFAADVLSRSLQDGTSLLDTVTDQETHVRHIEL